MKKIKRFILILIVFLTSLFSSGCAFFQDDLDVSYICEQKIPLEITNEPVELENVKFYVITSENAPEVFKELSDKGYDEVLFGLTDIDYQNLSVNMSKIIKFIVEQNGTIKAYKDYYEPVKEE